MIYVFNTFIIVIFGYIQGWDSAGYSILFRFIGEIYWIFYTI